MVEPNNYVDVFKKQNPKDLIEVMQLVRKQPKNKRIEFPYYLSDIVSWDQNAYVSPLHIDKFCKMLRKHPFYHLIKDAPFLHSDSSIILKYMGCSDADIVACKKIHIFGEMHTLIMSKAQIIIYNELGYAVSETYDFHYEQSVKNKLFERIIYGSIKLATAMIPNECFVKMPFGRIDTLKECTDSFARTIPLFQDSITELKNEYHEVLLIDIEDIL